MDPARAEQLLARIDVLTGEVLDPGPTDGGHRRSVALDGGTVTGANFRGTVLPGGTDRQVRLADGTTLVDITCTVRTHDGALVHVLVTGRLAPEDAGSPSGPSHTTVTFETDAVRYRWLARVTATCSVARVGPTLLADAWTVTTPGPGALAVAPRTIGAPRG